jgi:cytochrome c biogenesis protein CcdA
MRRILVLVALVAVVGSFGATDARADVVSASANAAPVDATTVAGSPSPTAESSARQLVIFWGNGCPHCAAEWEFLEQLASEFPSLEILGYEVWYSEENQLRFIATMAELGEEPAAVPTTIFGGRVWVGFGPEIETEIRVAAEGAFTDSGPIAPADDRSMTLPFLGVVDAGTTSLLVGTLVIAFVDGFNPCSLWALSMLLALVLRTSSRQRVLAVGTVFLVVTAGLYGLYIAGLYGTLQFMAHAAWIRSVIALIALVFGVINLKDFWWFRRGPSLTISDRAKPGLYRRMRAAASDERSLPAVLGGTALLALGVSLLETPCTAGYPLLWADLLSSQGVTTTVAVSLFGLYMIVFLLDEFAVFGAAVVAMRVSRLEERHGRVLKLVSGMLMVVWPWCS